MAKQLQFRRGTTVENNAFTGAMGEPTLDVDTGIIRVHDGETQGGAVFIDTVVDFQAPTADNGYTWYRKYASGWVEQGGSIDSASGTYTVTFPVTMADTHYTILKTMSTTSSNNAQYSQVSFFNKTTTSAETSTAGVGFSWQVSGMSAS